MMSIHRPAFSILRLMPAIPGSSRLGGWLLGTLALLLVLTQQGGQVHTLVHELSSARGQLAVQLAGHPSVQPAAVVGEPATTPSEPHAGASDERDAVDALCVLCVGFANTLATSAVSLPGVLPLLALGEFRPLSRFVWRQSSLRVGPPIRGPPATFSIPR